MLLTGFPGPPSASLNRAGQADWSLNHDGLSRAGSPNPRESRDVDLRGVEDVNKPSLFLGLREGVNRFLAREAKAAPAVAPAPAPVASTSPLKRAPLLSLASLASLSEPPPSAPAEVSIGKFGLIGLAELRETLGPRWPALSERVRSLAAAVISRHLGPRDMFEMQADGDYVVLFAELDKQAADFKCRAIGRDITERLLGSQTPRIADVESVSAQVSRQSLSLGELEKILAKAFATGEPVITSDPDSPRPPRPAGSPDRTPPADPRYPPSHDIVEAGWRDREQPRVAQPTPSVRRGWRYAPIWDARTASLVRFRLTPGEGTQPSLDRVLRHDPDPFEIDMLALTKAVGDLSRLTSEGRRLGVTCAIRQASLETHARRDRIVDALTRAAPLVRRLLALEVVVAEVETTFALSHLLDACQPLRVRCGLSVPLGARRSMRAVDERLGGVAVEVPARAPHDKVVADLAALSAQCSRAGLDAGAHGLDTPAVVAGALAAGVRFVSGEAVHADVRDLEQGFEIDPAGLASELRVKRRA